MHSFYGQTLWSLLSKFIKNFESKKVTSMDKIQVAILNNISPELSPILVKLFNCCQEGKCFPSL